MYRLLLTENVGFSLELHVHHFFYQRKIETSKTPASIKTPPQR